MNAVGNESSPGWSIRRPMPFTSLENSFSSFTLPSPSGSSSTVVPVFHSTSSFRTFPAPIVSPSFPSSSSALSAYPSPLGRERIVHLPAGSLDSRNPLTLHQNPLSPLPFSFSSGPPPSTYPSQDSVKEKFFIEPSRLMSGTDIKADVVDRIEDVGLSSRLVASVLDSPSWGFLSGQKPPKARANTISSSPSFLSTPTTSTVLPSSSSSFGTRLTEHQTRVGFHDLSPRASSILEEFRSDLGSLRGLSSRKPPSPHHSPFSLPFGTTSTSLSSPDPARFLSAFQTDQTPTEFESLRSRTKNFPSTLQNHSSSQKQNDRVSSSLRTPSLPTVAASLRSGEEYSTSKTTAIQESSMSFLRNDSTSLDIPIDQRVEINTPSEGKSSSVSALTPSVEKLIRGLETRVSFVEQTVKNLQQTIDELVDGIRKQSLKSTTSSRTCDERIDSTSNLGFSQRKVESVENQNRSRSDLSKHEFHSSGRLSSILESSFRL